MKSEIIVLTYASIQTPNVLVAFVILFMFTTNMSECTATLTL